MASAFDTAMAARNASMLARFGESISITPMGGAATPVTAVVDRESVMVEQLERDTDAVYTMTIHVQESDYATRTMKRDVATIDGASWHVDEELAVEAGMVTLSVKRRTTVDKHGNNARMER